MWRYLEGGGKRVIAVWHRRAGKDDVCLHWTAVSAAERPGNYWHMLPEAAQARKAIWNAVNPHTGKRRIDEAFPPNIRRRKNDQEMFIELINGSTWQVVGSDNYNSLVGSPPIGVVFSEWALADPDAWAYLRPILRENGGWAFFITTPRGRNHAARFYEGAKDDDQWFAELLPATETGVFTAEDLDQELREYIREYGPDEGEARFNQEYLCDFQAAIPGAYYGAYITALERQGRLSNVPWEPAVPVIVAWDLGIGDSTALWFCQQVGREVRLIDYYETSGVGLEHYVKVLKEKPYIYGEQILPHDADVHELGTGTTRVATLDQMGVRNIRVLPRTDPDTRINAARRVLPMCWFDKSNCERGIEALRQYRREWDDKLKTFKKRPLHDWSSHGSDAFGYLCEGIPDPADYGMEDYDFREDYARNAVSGY